MYKVILNLILFSGLSTLCIGQSEIVKGIEASESKVIKLGKSKPIKELVKIASTTAEKKAMNRKLKTAPENFVGRRGHSKVIFKELEHQGEDRIWQKNFGLNARPPVEPLVNIQGIGNIGSPHDPTGDIGQDFYLQAINVTDVGVFSKSGELIEEFAMNILWSEFNASSEGDPIILYDEEYEKWIITEFTDPANILIAVSETTDPLGAYDAYIFATTRFPDYPKYAIWSNSVVLTTNEEGAGTLSCYFLEREALMNGANDVTLQRISVPGNTNTEAGFFVATPVDWNGDLMPKDTKPIVLALNDSSWGSSAEDAVEIYHFDIDWANANNTVVTNTTIPLSPYDSYPCSESGFGFQCVPQLNGGGLDAIPEVIMNIPHLRNFGSHESLVFNFITDATDGDNISGIRWVELRNTDGTDWKLHQEGTFAPDDGLDRYMGSIAMDASGNIAMGYNVSSNETFVGIRYTGRLASDELGEMTFEEYIVAEGTNVINSGSRFGDYADMKVDAENGRTFWYTTEYANGGTSRTRIVAFEFQRDTFDLAMAAILNPISSGELGAEEIISVEIKNAGIRPIDTFDIGYFLEGNLIENITISETLNENESYMHSFVTTVDLSSIQDYQFKTYVNSALDKNALNDTLSLVVTKLPLIDVSIELGDISPSCELSVDVPLKFKNLGANTIEKIEVEIILNDGTPTYVEWTGLMAFNQSANFSTNLAGLIVGENVVQMQISAVNEMADPILENNQLNFNIEKFDPESKVKIKILTDNAPSETTWDIKDSNGVILYTGGPYQQSGTLYEEDACLDPDECYDFTIYDSYNDGICCYFGQGNYSIENGNGITLFESNGEFGSLETTQFCPNNSPCMLEVMIQVDDASSANAMDGSIMIIASNGLEPYQYSIDAGTSFQDSPLFENLSPDTYTITVSSAKEDCSFTEEVEVSFSTGIDEFMSNQLQFNIHPNPNNGYFQIELLNTQTSEYILDFQIYDAHGRLVQDRKFGKYDGIFKGAVSLVSWPDGVYFIKCQTDELQAMAKILKNNN